VIFGVCFTPFIDRWKAEGWKALRATGFTHVRLSVPLDRLCVDADPSTWRWVELDTLVKAITDADLKIYMNPGGCPSFASEGQPAYQDLLISSCWWNREFATRPRTDADPPWMPEAIPDAFAHGIHYFNQDPNRTDTRLDPATGHILTGPELAAIDQQQPPRPWLNNPPKMDPVFFRDIGFLLANRYKPFAIGIGNEYGGEMFNPWVKLDISRDGSVDMIREHLYPEMIKPFFDGVLAAQPDALVVGPDADSNIIMTRCCEVETRYAVRTGHSYGDLDGMDYSTSAAFVKAADGHPLWCSEIGGDPKTLVAWVRDAAPTRKYGAIFLLGQPWMPDPVIDLRNPDVAAMAAEFAKVNDPVKTAPVVRKRAMRT